MCVLKLKVNWLEDILGSEWEITPAGGATGEAYFAKFQDRKLFLKRNSSPFLAVLSAEGIVPKLVWTRRMENGDVITAQHWLDGRELKPKDMNSSRVTELLSKIHHSNELLDMLKRLGKTPLLPEDVLADILENVDERLQKESIVEQGISYLQAELTSIQTDKYVVCHCDVNHNNWMLGENTQLYLIDWDGAMIADPAIDLGLLLYWYINPSQWEEWLEHYGIELTENLKKRMKWYVISQTILFIEWHRSKNEHSEMNYWLEYLRLLLVNDIQAQ
ncbi:phosphotransferase family protein [Priestia aryabhattai]|nr:MULTISPECIES: phosphotransferase family protein [Priestia]MCM3250577.1 phosphotransferase family protein [Priestia aryabhattai]MCM3642358.1 phosphotransferase family protein [Priestia aryabhattai]